jgi:Hepatocellular carcinoma-associated antigen 59
MLNFGRMAYIEENLKLLREQQGAGGSHDAAAEEGGNGKDEVGDMVKFGDKYKTTSKELKEGSVTASLAMLSAIPEVDLGME